VPTIFTHALLPLIGAAALPQLRLSKRLVAAGMAAAVIPDLDVLTGPLFQIPHTHDFGHRGASHTLLFALLLASVAMLRAGALRAPPLTAFLFLALATVSHSLADMLTQGGKGIMILWPLEDARFKFLLHPIEASPVGMKAFETGVIWQVLLSETLWLLLPAALVAFFTRLAIKSAAPRSVAD
jgi:inner membrane protein